MWGKWFSLFTWISLSLLIQFLTAFFLRNLCVVVQKSDPSNEWGTGRAAPRGRWKTAPPQTGSLSQVGTPRDPMLFNTLTSDVEHGISCTLRRPTDGPKLSGEVDTGRTTLQEGLCRSGLTRTLKFNKCKVLNLGKHSSGV